ncbi:MAG: HalD/BesD family halogenase [Ilumatobacteraceae bacterium]
MTLALERNIDLARIVDTDRYALDAVGDPSRNVAVEQAREQLAASGCARLPGFVRPGMRDRLTAETTAVAPDAYRISQEITPYSDHGDDAWPQDHPRRRVGTMTNGFVGKDLIPDDTAIRALYDEPSFRRFIADCLGLDELHQFADPIRGLVVNVMDDGTQMPWHYDANEFIVSLMTRRPSSGGVFEYCPDLRRPGDERYDDVREVLDGDRRRVRTLELEVGDLQIFRGRYSMHRVTPTAGERHTVLFGFSETPGYIGGVESTRIGYGRVTRAHLEAEQGHVDGLAG